MMRAPYVCAVLAVTVAGSEVLDAQGLGALAARTAEERKALEGQPSVSISDDDLPDDSRLEQALQDFALTRQGYFRYIDARASVLSMRLQVPDLDALLFAAENRGAGPLAIQKLISEDWRLKGMLANAGISPGAYTLNEMAFRRALQDASLPPAEKGRLSPTRAANIGFAQLSEVRSTMAVRWGQLERNLALQHQARAR